MNTQKLLAVIDDLLQEVELEGKEDAIAIYLGGPMLGIFHDAAKGGADHATSSPATYRMISVLPYNFNAYAIIVSTRRK